MSRQLSFIPITRDNWEATMKLGVHDEQRKFVPSVAESLAAAYVKPWDEQLDPFVFLDDDIMIGCFYLSYTPESRDNYWIGGFFIDKQFQGKGYGRIALRQILEFVGRMHPMCEVVNLTVESENLVAQRLYKSMGFSDTGQINKYGEIIYRLPVNRDGDDRA